MIGVGDAASGAAAWAQAHHAQRLDPERVLVTVDALAPAMQGLVAAVLQSSIRAGASAKVVETIRGKARQEWLYAQGRTRPGEIVTYAPDGDTSWHYWGLAVDFVSERDEWNAPDAWWVALAGWVQDAGGLSGLHWRMQDRPHAQWGHCSTAPTPDDRQAYSQGGIGRVWMRNLAD